MSESRHIQSTEAPAEAGEVDAEPAYVPHSSRDWTPPGRFARIGAERASAAAQIQRSLKVWRKASGAEIRETPAPISLGKKSGKEKADDIPSWAAGSKMNPGETPVQAADRVMKQRFPDGDCPRGPGSEHNKLKKYFERSG